MTMGISLPIAKEICSLYRLMPGPEVAVRTFMPPMEAPRHRPIEAISSSPWMHTPPSGGSMASMWFKMVVAGVIG